MNKLELALYNLKNQLGAIVPKDTQIGEIPPLSVPLSQLTFLQEQTWRAYVQIVEGEYEY